MTEQEEKQLHKLLKEYEKSRNTPMGDGLAELFELYAFLKDIFADDGFSCSDALESLEPL